MSFQTALLGATRFGLGPNPGELRALGPDPRAAFIAMTRRPPPAPASAPPVANLSASVRDCIDWRTRRKAIGRRFASLGAEEIKERQRAEVGSNCFTAAYDEEVAAWIDGAVATDNPLFERLVRFWSNHFTISGAKNPSVKVAAGHFERVAIRPHVLGRFRDMLGAVASHPAMLVYLDNQRSVGPNSKAGGPDRGLNENFARELLELHTVGVDGGYAQEDVTNLARILTGWSVTGNKDAEPFRTHFVAGQHEPGAWNVLGRRFAEDGQAQGEAALDMLAAHPATARNIARRMCRHFVAENPPPALVDRLAATFRSTDGDLAAVARTLLASDEAWTPERRKLVPPFDFVVTALRATGIRPPHPLLRRTLRNLGQPLWSAPSPEGWPEEDEAWAAPDALNERIDWAQDLARRVTDLDVPALAGAVLGDTLGAHERGAIARAGSRDQALAMFLMLPQFQRR